MGNAFNYAQESILGGAGDNGNDRGGLGSNGSVDSDNRMYGSTFSGSNADIDNRPPYYALAYIMYIGI